MKIYGFGVASDHLTVCLRREPRGDRNRDTESPKDIICTISPDPASGNTYVR